MTENVLIRTTDGRLHFYTRTAGVEIQPNAGLAVVRVDDRTAIFPLANVTLIETGSAVTRPRA